MNQFLKTSVFLMSSALLLGSCSDENSNPQEPDNPMESDANYVARHRMVLPPRSGIQVVNWELQITYPPTVMRMKPQQLPIKVLQHVST